MIVNAEYYIRRKEGQFEVAKFEGRSWPSAVYYVFHNTDGWNCTCSGAMRNGGGINEKHVQMVGKWLAMGCQLPLALQDFVNPFKSKPTRTGTNSSFRRFAFSRRDNKLRRVR